MSVEIMPISLSGTWLALPASSVEEVVGQERFTPIPNATPEIPGVLPWRGRAIALVDLGRLVGLSAGLGAEAAPRHVIVRAQECTLAIPVDSVREVQSIADDRVHPQNATRMRFATREVELDGTPMPLVEVGELVRALAGATEQPS